MVANATKVRHEWPARGADNFVKQGTRAFPVYYVSRENKFA